MSELRQKLILEQYRQAGKEYRSEDRNRWQTFAIILALNGVLFGFIKFGKWDEFFFLTPFLVIVGWCSTIAGILLIARIVTYQNQRMLIAQKIQEKFGGEKLYFAGPFNEHAKKENITIKPSGRVRGGSIFQVVLGILFLMWVLIFFSWWLLMAWRGLLWLNCFRCFCWLHSHKITRKLQCGFIFFGIFAASREGFAYLQVGGPQKPSFGWL